MSSHTKKLVLPRGSIITFLRLLLLSFGFVSRTYWAVSMLSTVLILLISLGGSPYERLYSILLHLLMVFELLDALALSCFSLLSAIPLVCSLYLSGVHSDHRCSMYEPYAHHLCISRYMSCSFLPSLSSLTDYDTTFLDIPDRSLSIIIRVFLSGYLGCFLPLPFLGPYPNLLLHHHTSLLLLLA